MALANNIQTTFAIVASWAMREWYGNDDFTQGRYKAKGETTCVVAKGFTLEALQALSLEDEGGYGGRCCS